MTPFVVFIITEELQNLHIPDVFSAETCTNLVGKDLMSPEEPTNDRENLKSAWKFDRLNQDWESQIFLFFPLRAWWRSGGLQSQETHFTDTNKCKFRASPLLLLLEEL